MEPPAWLAAAAIVLAAVLFTGCSYPTVTGDRLEPAFANSTPAPPTPLSSAPSSDASRSARHRSAITPCRSNHLAKWIFVSPARQHMWLCERGRAVRDVPVTTGMLGRDTETPTGRYRIQGLNRDTTLTLSTGATYPVKYWIPFDAPLFGFHDSAWQDFPYGSAKYRTDGSHGCIHVPLAAIRFLYRWAEIGTALTIR